MTKDRFSSFRKRRQVYLKEDEAIGGDGSNEDLLGAAASFNEGAVAVVLQMEMDHPGSDNPILQMYYEQVEEAQNLLEEMKVDITHVKGLHSTIISSPIYEDEAKVKLEQLTSTITKTSNLFRIKLTEIKNSITEEGEKDIVENEERNRNLDADSNSGPRPGTRRGKGKGISARVRIGETQHFALLNCFMEIMNEYQLEQTDHRNRCKARIGRQLSITGNSLTEEEVDKMIDEGNFTVFTQDIIQETAEARETLALLEVRHSELKKLEKDLEMLLGLMQEMAVLVQNQGELIDNVERNVENASDYVSNATGMTHRAKVYHNSTLKKKICVGGIIAPIILVLILVIYFTSGE